MMPFHVITWFTFLTIRKVLSDHDKLGKVEISLGQIMSAGGQGWKGMLKDAHGGEMMVIGEQVRGNSNETLTMDLAASSLDNKDSWGKSDPFLEIYRGDVLVYRFGFELNQQISKINLTDLRELRIL